MNFPKVSLCYAGESLGFYVVSKLCVWVSLNRATGNPRGGGERNRVAILLLFGQNCLRVHRKFLVTNFTCQP
jgi:hypothetical protein